MNRLGFAWLVLTLVAAGLEPVHAQPPSSSGSGRSDRHRYGHDSPEDRARRLNYAVTGLKQFDTNHNGMLDADEVTGSRRSYVEKYVERAGMEMRFPIRIDTVATGLQKYYSSPQEESKPGSGYSSSSGSSHGPSYSSSSGGGSSSSSGFGSSSSGGGGSSTPSSSGSSSSGSSGGSSSSGSSSMETRIRGYAANMLRQYDTNKNGTLEQDEWTKMSMDVSAADRNRDGRITGDELGDWLLEYTRARMGGGSSGSTASGSSSSPSTTASSSSSPSSSPSSATSMYRPATPVSSSAGGAGRRTYRFLSPQERLPKGLPDWFLAKDVNRDGQVSMSEFSSTWDDNTISQFIRFDLNGDGVITADECLKAERGRK